MLTLTTPAPARSTNPLRGDSWLRAAADHPRRLRLRRALFQVHLWAGLLVGLQATVIGLTGSAIVFREALSAKLEPSLYRIARPAPGTPDLGSMLAAVQRAFPNRVVLDASPRDSGVWAFRVQPASPGDRTVAFVDPSTNRFLGAELENKGLLNTLAFLHFELLGGSTGRLLNGIGALLLLTVSLTGVVLWWPGRKRWRGSLKVHRRARPARLNWDLHTAGGFYTCAFLVVLSFTGAYLTLPVVGQAVSVLTGGHAHDSDALFAPSHSTSTAALSDAPLQPLLVHANALRTGYQARFIELPRLPGDAVTMILDNGSQERTGDFLLADFDRRDGHLLRLFDSHTQRFGLRLLLFFGPLHFGTFGGLTTRVLWVVLGLSPGVLFFTGFFLWWGRVLRKRFPLRRTRTTANHPSVV